MMPPDPSKPTQSNNLYTVLPIYNSDNEDK
jgi:hypothetical protein